MKLLANKKFTAWTIGILLVLNLASLAALGIETHVFDFDRWKDDDRKDHKDRVTRYLVKNLDFNEQQSEELKALTQEHRNQIRPVFEEIRDKRRELLNELTSAEPDTVTLNKLTAEVGQLVSHQERLTYQHFKDIRSLCTPEQLDNYDQVMTKLMRYMSPKFGPSDRKRGGKRD